MKQKEESLVLTALTRRKKSKNALVLQTLQADQKIDRLEKQKAALEAVAVHVLRQYGGLSQNDIDTGFAYKLEQDDIDALPKSCVVDVSCSLMEDHKHEHFPIVLNIGKSRTRENVNALLEQLTKVFGKENVTILDDET